MKIIFVNQFAAHLKATALVFAVICYSGCFTDRFPDARYQPGVGGEILTEDRNNDGIIDREFHDSNLSDGDWEYQDNDFDGIYERLTIYGVGVFEREVRVPVPEN